MPPTRCRFLSRTITFLLIPCLLQASILPVIPAKAEVTTKEFTSQALGVRALLMRGASSPVFGLVSAFKKWRSRPLQNGDSLNAGQKAQLRRIYQLVALGISLISGTLFGLAWWAAGGLSSWTDTRKFVVGALFGGAIVRTLHVLTPSDWRSTLRKLRRRMRPEEVPTFNPTAEQSFEEWRRERESKDSDDREHGEIQYHRAIFLSDIHLGALLFDPDKLLRFIRHNKAPILYINGDFIGGIELMRRFYWPDKYHDVFKKLLREVGKGTRVVITPGNHDPFIDDYEGLEMHGVTITREAVHITATGARLRVVHGDEYDTAVLSSPWLKHWGAWGLEMAYWLNGPLAALRRFFGMPPFSLSTYLQEHVDDSPELLAYYVKCMETEAARRGLDGTIGAHVHRYASEMIEDDYYYGNPGDGVKKFTALVEDAEGYFKNVPLDSRDATDAGRSYEAPIQVHPRSLPTQTWEGFDVQNIQLFATDKDNTLLREREDPEPETVELLEEFKRLAEHAQLAVLTGEDKTITDRQLWNRFSSEFQKVFYRFTDGGGTGYAPHGALIYDHPMSPDIRRRLRSRVQETLRDALRGPLGEELGITFDDLGIDDKPAGFSMVPKEKAVMERIRDHHPEAWDLLTQQVQRAIAGDAELATMGYRAINSATAIDLLKVDKGEALQFLAAHLAGEHSAAEILRHTVALGDSPNDIPMLELVARSGGRAFWVGEMIPENLNPNIIRLQAHGPLGFRQVLRSLIQELRRYGSSSYTKPLAMAA